MGSANSKANKKKCGIIDDAQQIRIDSSPLHCPICLSVFRKAPEILPCGHSHCTDCLDRLKNYAQRSAEGRSFNVISFECPLCRSSVPNQRFRVKNFAIEAILDSLETYKQDDDPTNEIIATLELVVKRISGEKRELEQKINQLNGQINSQRKFGIGLLSLLTIGFFSLLIRGIHQFANQ